MTRGQGRESETDVGTGRVVWGQNRCEVKKMKLCAGVRAREVVGKLRHEVKNNLTG